MKEKKWKAKKIGKEMSWMNKYWHGVQIKGF
jgi:hypothetical protein